jgi:ribose/xylose/arabinose/galactoside ABC-type transport system permease subunit
MTRLWKTGGVKMAREAAANKSFDLSTVTTWVRGRGVYVAFVVLVLFNLIVTPNFASVVTVSTLLITVSPIVLVSLGMALAIGTEGIDLSVGAVMAIASAFLPLYLGYGWPIAILVTLLVGALAGLVNGSLVAFVGVQPIIATLAMLVGGRGLAQIFSGGQSLPITDMSILWLGQGRLFGIPAPVIVAVVAVLVVGFLVNRTTFGRYVVAIGGNRSASYLSGHPVRRTLLAVYIISALLAVVAGVVTTARLGASDPSNVGLLIELSAITAVVVGGTPLSGGKVKILGTVMGALLIQLISNTFITNNLPFTWAQVLTAAIILVAVYLQKGRGVA